VKNNTPIKKMSSIDFIH